jgi:hypothetical protein
MDTTYIHQTSHHTPDFQARLDALGISQRAMARALRRDPGHVSRVLHGFVTSAPMLRKVETFLAKAERRARPLKSA